MYRGKIVEIGDSEQITTRPAHPYTQQLVAATPEVLV
jgi:peptide/nickel transport system ATP-binding protein